jgi:hypothetical protein
MLFITFVGGCSQKEIEDDDDYQNSASIETISEIPFEIILDEYVILDKSDKSNTLDNLLVKVKSVDEIKNFLPTKDDWNSLNEQFDFKNYDFQEYSMYYARVYFEGNVVPTGSLLKIRNIEGTLVLTFESSGTAEVTFEEDNDKEPLLYRHVLMNLKTYNSLLEKVELEFFN